MTVSRELLCESQSEFGVCTKPKIQTMCMICGDRLTVLSYLGSLPWFPVSAKTVSALEIINWKTRKNPFYIFQAQKDHIR